MPRARLLAVAALVGGTLLAGCGGSSSGPGVATVVSTTTAGTTNAPSRAANAGNSLLAFAKCMRSGGVPNFPDPGTEKRGIRVGARIDPSSPAFQAAQAKCQKFAPLPPGPGTTTSPSKQVLAHFLKVTQCIRQHGFPEFPDPRTSIPSDLVGIGVVADREGAILLIPSRIDQRSPAYEHAAAACAFPLRNH